MYKFQPLFYFLFFYFFREAVFAQPVTLYGNQDTSVKSTEFKIGKVSDPVNINEGMSEKEIYLQRNNKLSVYNGAKENLYKNNQQNIEKTADISTAAPVTINLSVREKDIYKSQVVSKHFPHDKLNKIKLSKPEKIDQIDFYFNKSFLFQLLTPVSDQKKIDDFIANFDPADYETQRKANERTYIDNKESGVRVILLSDEELPFKIPAKFKTQVSGDSECVGCEEGRKVPQSTDIPRKKQ